MRLYNYPSVPMLPFDSLLGFLVLLWLFVCRKRLRGGYSGRAFCNLGSFLKVKLAVRPQKRAGKGQTGPKRVRQIPLIGYLGIKTLF